MPAKLVKPDPFQLAVSVKQAAKLLNVSERTLWSLSSPRGPIPVTRFGRAVRYEVEQIKRFLATGGSK